MKRRKCHSYPIYRSWSLFQDNKWTIMLMKIVFWCTFREYQKFLGFFSRMKHICAVGLMFLKVYFFSLSPKSILNFSFHQIFIQQQNIKEVCILKSKKTFSSDFLIKRKKWRKSVNKKSSERKSRELKKVVG